MDLIDRLKQALPVSEYGTGKAKSFQHLLKEIENGEAIIKWQDGNPVRVLKVARLWVRSELGLLKESRQVFSGGRVRERSLASSLSEKFDPKESPIQACKRALLEELGIRGGCKITPRGDSLEEDYSPSYPELLSRYEFHDFDVFVQDPDSSYQEESGGKTTYFEWV